MNESLTISVHNKFDIVEARMQVRTLARKIGLDLFDQARISLATSTLAIMLGMEAAGKGQIALGCLEDNGRKGVQVVCTKPDTLLHDLATGVLDDAKQMVDDLLVEALPSRGIKVTLIKWAGGRQRAASDAGPISLAEADLLNT
jgi:hypothetical protein